MHKPVELFGKYSASTAAVTTASSVTNVLVDQYGRLQTVGAAASGASTSGINPTLIAGVDSTGSITTLLTSGGTITANTELELTGTLIANVTIFKDPSGSLTWGLVDATSNRIVLSPTSTVVLNATSTIGAAISWATGSTLDVSFAPTSTLGAAITGDITTSSTISVITGSRYYLGSQLFTGTVVAESGTVNSGTIDISKYEIKTVSVYVTSADNNSTLLIDVAPVASSTIHNYYSTHVSSTSFTTKSFTEAFADIRAQVISGTADSTVDAWLGLMA